MRGKGAEDEGAVSWEGERTGEEVQEGGEVSWVCGRVEAG